MYLLRATPLARRTPRLRGNLPVPRAHLRRTARAEIARYETVEFRETEVTDIVRVNENSFIVRSRERALPCKKVLLATGLIDDLPPVPGLERLFGAGIYSCPYCDGWEHRDQALAAYDRQGRFSLGLLQWSRDLVILSDGPAVIEREIRERLERMSIPIEQRKIERFVRDGKQIVVHFADGDRLRRQALFVNGACHPHSDLSRRLGCKTDEPSNKSARPWNAPKTWENGLPVGLTEGR